MRQIPADVHVFGLMEKIPSMLEIYDSARRTEEEKERRKDEGIERRMLNE